MDPTLLGPIINGVVSTVSAFLMYKVGMKQAEAKGTPEKPDDSKLKEGETALTVVKAAISQHGGEDEQTVLAGFQQNPVMFRATFVEVLTALAQRSPAFAQQLQELAQQGKVQTGGVHIGDEAKVYGSVVERNDGTITSTYNFTDRKGE